MAFFSQNLLKPLSLYEKKNLPFYSVSNKFCLKIVSFSNAWLPLKSCIFFMVFLNTLKSYQKKITKNSYNALPFKFHVVNDSVWCFNTNSLIKMRKCI